MRLRTKSVVVSVSRIVRNVNDDAAQSVTARITPGFEGTFEWSLGNAYGDASWVTPDVLWASPLLTVTFTPYGWLNPSEAATATLSYCARLHKPQDCPRYWADWSPLDWCPFCATLVLRLVV